MNQYTGTKKINSTFIQGGKLDYEYSVNGMELPGPEGGERPHPYINFCDEVEIKGVAIDPETGKEYPFVVEDLVYPSYDHTFGRIEYQLQTCSNGGDEIYIFEQLKGRMPTDLANEIDEIIKSEFDPTSVAEGIFEHEMLGRANYIRKNLATGEYAFVDGVQASSTEFHATVEALVDEEKLGAHLEHMGVDLESIWFHREDQDRAMQGCKFA